MQKYQDTVVVSTPTLIPLAGAVVTILNTSGGSSNMYSDNGVTVVASVTTDTNGRYSFYAADGKYTITITPPAPYSVVVLTDVVIEDPNVAHPILGITDGSPSAAGYIGEYISAEVLNSAPMAVLAATNTNLLTLTLTPGKWEIYSQSRFITTAGATTFAQEGISDVSLTIPSEDYIDIGIPGILRWGKVLPLRRFNVVVNTPIYLVVYNAAAANYAGEIIAKRVG